MGGLEKRRLFTLDEANSLIPELEEEFGKVFETKHLMEATKVRIENLEKFWGKDLFAPDNAEKELYFQLKAQLNVMLEDLATSLAIIEKKGCVIKDADLGLIDFYSVKDSEPILFCWKFGESKIEFWHPVGKGFQDRKPLQTGQTN